MGWSDFFEDHSNEYGSKHEASLSHELISGAAAFEAAKAYEDHVAANGHPDSHARAKEVMAGLAGAFIDREFETKGLDYLDRARAKRQATEHIEERFTEDDYISYRN